MKKKCIGLLFAASCVMVACSNPAASSSSGSLSSSSSVSSSLSSSSSSSSSSSLVEPGELVKEVALFTKNYNGGLSETELANKANVAVDCGSTYGNLVLLLEGAFKDSMPSLKGARNYEASFDVPDSVTIVTPAVREAFDWMVSYGLWGTASFSESETVTEASVKQIIKRFAAYYGTEKNDDFYDTVNHDYLYENSDDEKVGQNDFFYASNLLSVDGINNNCLAFVKEMASTNDDKSTFYKWLLDYYENKLDYSFLDDATVKADLAKINAISSLSDWISYSASMMAECGDSPLLAYVNTGNYAVDGVASSYTLFEGGALPQHDTLSFDEEATLGKAEYYLPKLGYSGDELSSYAAAYLSFEKKANAFYVSSDLDEIRGSAALILTSNGSSDLFGSYGVSIDLPAFFVSSGYGERDIYHTIAKNAGSLVSLAKAVETATKDELIAITLVEYVIANFKAICYSEGETPELSFLVGLGEYNIASDYMNSSYFTSSFDAFASMFSDIKDTFASRIDTSSWLSVDGKAAVKEKLGNVHYAMIGKTDTGGLIDYASLSLSDGLTVREAYAKKRALSVKTFLSNNNNEMKSELAFLKDNSPFYPNALYFRNSNGFCLTMGAAFWINYDISMVSREVLLGKIGYVIAHELTHGFDSNGVYYDKNGSRVDTSIIPSDDSTKFFALAAEVVSMYNENEVMPGIIQDNSKTISECLADFGGLAFTEAIVEADKSLSLEKFYTAFAEAGGAKVTFMYYTFGLYSDSHSFGRARVNTLLSNSKLFIETYGIKEGDMMYRNGSYIVVW